MLVAVRVVIAEGGSRTRRAEAALHRGAPESGDAAWSLTCL